MGQEPFRCVVSSPRLVATREVYMQLASKYRSEDHLTLTYRGVTIRMEANDPRLPFIELLIFGQTLPAPVPVPEVEVAPPAPPPDAPVVDVPDAWVKLWQSLPNLHRRLLLTLTGEPVTAHALEEKFKLKVGGMRAVNILVSVRAKEMKLPMPIKSIGRGRKTRRYFVDQETRRWLLELDRRWADVDAAMRGRA